MKRTLIQGFILPLILVVLSAASCKKKEDKEDPQVTDTYDRASLLNNYTHQLIIPNYQTLDGKLDTLLISVSQFVNAPTLSTLNEARLRFKIAYREWMHCSMYEFGPAYNTLLRSSVNTWPLDSAQVNVNVSTGIYDLGTAANIDAIGFPALDYLLYGCGGTDASILARYTTASDALTRRTYLSDVTSDLKTKVTSVLQQWQNGYNATFTGNLSSSTGAPLSDIVNQLNYDYEVMKNGRVGIPLGKQSMGVVLPEKCEALYSSYSVQLIKESVIGLEDFYLGRDAQGNNGPGLDDYLEHLGAQYLGGSLNVAIQNKFQEVKQAVDAIPDPLSQTVVNNPTPVDNAYLKMQELLLFLKTDLPSALSILITYADMDGD